MKPDKIHYKAKEIRHIISEAKLTDSNFERGHLIERASTLAKEIQNEIEPEVPKNATEKADSE